MKLKSPNKQTRWKTSVA